MRAPTRVVHRSCSSVRGALRCRRRDGRRRRPHRARRSRGRPLARLHLPEGVRPEGPPGRPRPPAPPADPRRRDLPRGVVGGGAGSRRDAPARDPRRARPRRDRDRTSATRTPTTTAPSCTDRCCCARSARKWRFSATSVDQLPKMISSARALRRPARDPDPRHRPHRLPAHARRQPARVERQPDDGARLPGPPRGAPRARRHARRRRSAAQRDGSDRGSSISSSAPAADALLLFALVHVLFDEKLVRLGRLAAFTNGVDRDRGAGARLRARSASPRRRGIDAASIRRLARDFAAAPSARPATAASAPARRSSARSRAGSSTC